MAVVATFAESFVEAIFKGEHNLTSDNIKLALMNTTFAFDPETHVNWADVSTDEIAAANGYTTKGIQITPIAVAATVTASDGIIEITTSAPTIATWTATGGSIGTTGSAILFNDTHASDAIIMCIDFGADYETTVGKLFRVDFTNGIANATITI